MGERGGEGGVRLRETGRGRGKGRGKRKGDRTIRRERRERKRGRAEMMERRKKKGRRKDPSVETRLPASAPLPGGSAPLRRRDRQLPPPPLDGRGRETRARVEAPLRGEAQQRADGRRTGRRPALGWRHNKGSGWREKGRRGLVRERSLWKGGAQNRWSDGNGAGASSDRMGLSGSRPGARTSKEGKRAPLR